MSQPKYKLKPDARVGTKAQIPTMSHGLMQYRVTSIEQSNGTPVSNPLIGLRYSGGKAESYPQEFILMPLDTLAELCEECHIVFKFWTLNKQYNPK